MALGSKTHALFASIVAMSGGKGQSMAGLPAHLRVVREDGEPSNSLRRQFQKGKASAKKRGK